MIEIAGYQEKDKMHTNYGGLWIQWIQNIQDLLF